MKTSASERSAAYTNPAAVLKVKESESALVDKRRLLEPKLNEKKAVFSLKKESNCPRTLLKVKELETVLLKPLPLSTPLKLKKSLKFELADK